MSGNKSSKKVKVPTKEIDVIEAELGSFDKGPEGSQFVFEITLADKILTLYTHDQESMDNFVHCILQILIFKVQILDRQKKLDAVMADKMETQQRQIEE